METKPTSYIIISTHPFSATIVTPNDRFDVKVPEEIEEDQDPDLHKAWVLDLMKMYRLTHVQGLGESYFLTLSEYKNWA